MKMKSINSELKRELNQIEVNLKQSLEAEYQITGFDLENQKKRLLLELLKEQTSYEDTDNSIS